MKFRSHLITIWSSLAIIFLHTGITCLLLVAAIQENTQLKNPNLVLSLSLTWDLYYCISSWAGCCCQIQWQNHCSHWNDSARVTCIYGIYMKPLIPQPPTYGVLYQSMRSPSKFCSDDIIHATLYLLENFGGWSSVNSDRTKISWTWFWSCSQQFYTSIDYFGDAPDLHQGELD